MSGTGRYRVNEPTVIHQTIGGETVIIHLTSGLYYNLEGSGADIWESLRNGGSTDAIIDELAGASSPDRGVVATEVLTFIDRLVDEDLIVAEPGRSAPVAAAGGRDPSSAPQSSASTSVGAYRSPRVTRYDDLQDLLLLDPIHAVDESGWPERPQPSTAAAGGHGPDTSG